MYAQWQTIIFVLILAILIIGINTILFLTRKSVGRKFCLVVCALFILAEIAKACYQIAVKKELNSPKLWMPLNICSFSWICLLIYALFYKKFIGKCFLGAYFIVGGVLAILIFIFPDAMTDDLFSKQFGGAYASNWFFTYYSFLYHSSWTLIFFIVFFNLNVTITFKNNYLVGYITVLSLLSIVLIIESIAIFGFHEEILSWDGCYFYKAPVPALQVLYDKMGWASGIIVISLFAIACPGFFAFQIFIRGHLFKLKWFKNRPLLSKFKQ